MAKLKDREELGEKSDMGWKYQTMVWNQINWRARIQYKRQK